MCTAMVGKLYTIMAGEITGETAKKDLSDAVPYATCVYNGQSLRPHVYEWPFLRNG